MNDLAVEIRVQAPDGVIWALWSDLPASPRWDTDVRQCSLYGPFEAGSEGLCILRNGVRMPLRLEEVVYRQSYRNSARLLWIHLSFSHHLYRVAPGVTHVVHAVHVTGRFSILYRWLLVGVLRTAMGKALRNLRNLAEQPAGETVPTPPSPR
ncbi:SRPBCC family protein [Pseudomonas aeruginosa]|uniref:SRPBCC family protein n=1 Tax=Pseudomonas aeruginosa TaxID=287 RepID=UPI00232B662C|nr:SRPBCC family protein [Pseudomonas aeruginosa]